MPMTNDSRVLDGRRRTAGSVDTAPDAPHDVRRPVSSKPRGRLIFALDATMSRQPTWDLAISLQGQMFDTTAALGGLDVQLV